MEVQVEENNDNEEDINDLLGDITDDENEENDGVINVDSLNELNVSDKEVEVDINEQNPEIKVDLKKLSEIKKEGDLDQIFGKLSESKVNLQTDRLKSITNMNINKTTRIPQQNSSYSVRTPNFIKIQNKPYNSETYDKNYEESLYGKDVGTIVRWRNKTDENGNIIVDPLTKKPLVESNARLIKWKDGAFQLVVGDSVFNLKIIPTENKLLLLFYCAI